MKKKLLGVLLVLCLVVCLLPTAAWADTTPLENVTFGYAYDTQRSPSFPTSGASVSASQFQKPFGPDGDQLVTDAGSWTLTKVGTYSYVNKAGNATNRLTTIVEEFVSEYASKGTTIDTDTVMIHELKNGTDHIAYGVVVAYDPTEQCVLFVGDALRGGAGYLVSVTQLTIGYSSSKTITATKIVADIASGYSISLDWSGSLPLGPSQEGYTTDDLVKTVKVSNTGNAATGNLNVTLTGKDASSFELAGVDAAFQAGIAVNGFDTFKVAPKADLPVGTYTATVTVSGDNVDSQSFNVSFAVTSAGGTTHTHSWTYAADGANAIKATCTAEGCDNTDGGKVTLSAPTDLTFDGNAKQATLSGSFTTGEAIPTIGYLKKAGSDYEGMASGSFPTAVGDYRAKITVQGVEAHIDFAIQKAAARTLDDIEANCVYTLTAEQSVQIGSIMPGNAGDLSYTTGSWSATGLASVGTFTVDNDGLVKYTFTGGAIGEVITLPVVIKSANYADSTVYVKITLIKATTTGGGGGGSSKSYYSVVVNKVKGGTVSVSSSTATKGTTLTLNVSPEEGFALDSLTVLDKSNKEVALTKASDNKYTFAMPAGKVTVMAVFEQIAASDEASDDKDDKSEQTAKSSFKDVADGAYYAKAVQWAAENGITQGITADQFGPDMDCTRAQMVAFLWRAAGSPEPIGTDCPFDDVDLNSYYAKAVQWAVEQDITKGETASSFAPNAVCTRAQMVTFICRVAGGEPAGNTTEFDDVAAGAYYADAIRWAVEQGIANGVEQGKFAPDSTCTRATMVTFLYRYFGK